MVLYERPKPLIKRVPIIADATDKVMRWDTDNLYPQRAEATLRESSGLKTLYARIADFVNGEGFTDQIVAQTQLNNLGLKGQTANRVLQRVAREFVKWETKCAHVGYNMLGQMTAIHSLRVMDVRMKIYDQAGNITHYGYNPNWEKDGRKGQEDAITFYPRFNPDPAVVVQQIEEAGGIECYKGQIIFDTPNPNEYPDAVFHAVMNDGQVQGEASTFKVGNIQQSFLATLAVVYPGEFADEQEKQAFNALIANKAGARNAGTRIGIQDKTGTKKASDIFQSLSPENLDRLFEYTERSVKENIMESESFPAILMGKTPTGLFAQGDIEDCYTWVNAITRNRRQELSDFFSLLLSYWHEPIVTDAAITPQQYQYDEQSTGGTGAAGGGSVEINDNLKNMTGRQAINFERILRKYGRKQYDRQTASQLLQGGFGLSTEEITKLLDGIDQLNAEEEAQADPAATPAARQVKALARQRAFVVAMINEML